MEYFTACMRGSRRLDQRRAAASTIAAPTQASAKARPMPSKRSRSKRVKADGGVISIAARNAEMAIAARRGLRNAGSEIGDFIIPAKLHEIRLAALQMTMAISARAIQRHAEVPNS